MSLFKQKINPRTGQWNLILDTTIAKFIGVVATTSALPLTGNLQNDCYVVEADDRIYTWNSSSSSGTIDKWIDIGSATSIDWSSITSKPSSTVADIDDSVSLKHTQNTDTDLIVNSVEIINNQTTFAESDMDTTRRVVVFTANRTGTFSKVSVGIYTDSITGTTGHLLVQLKEVTQNHPIPSGYFTTSTILESKQVAVGDLVNGWNNIVTGWATVLDKDTQYAVIFTLVGDISFNWYKSYDSNIYPLYFCQYSADDYWYYNANNSDFQIKTYITVTGGNLITNGQLISDLGVADLIRIDGRDLSVDGIKLDTVESSSVSLETVKGDTDIADSISLKHTQNTDNDTTTLINTPDLSGVSDYTLVLEDKGKFIDLDKATAITLTIPGNDLVAFPIGTSIFIRQKGVGAITITPQSGSGLDTVTVDSKDGLVTNGQYSAASLLKIATNTWASFGGLTV